MKRINLKAVFSDGTTFVPEWGWALDTVEETVRILEFEGKRVVELWFDNTKVVG